MYVIRIYAVSLPFLTHVYYMHAYARLCSGMEELIKRYPQHVNLKKDDSFNPLMVAAANGYTDIISLLASHVRA